jgi:hypothetical protein
MNKFRKKPVVIEAVRLTPDSFLDAGYWVDEGIAGWNGPAAGGPVYLDIVTLEGTMRANDGDWIIKGVNGEFYPCKDDIFQKSYEPAEDDAK